LLPEIPAGITGGYEWPPNLIDWYPGDGPSGGPQTTITAETTDGTARLIRDHVSLFLRASVRRDW